MRIVPRSMSGVGDYAEVPGSEKSVRGAPWKVHRLWRMRRILPRTRGVGSIRVLAATVFRNRAQEGKRRSGWGDERGCLPVSFVVKHGIENNEELAHAGDERGLGVLTVGAQPEIESSDGGISWHSRHPPPIHAASHLGASAP